MKRSIKSLVIGVFDLTIFPESVAEKINFLLKMIVKNRLKKTTSTVLTDLRY